LRLVLIFLFLFTMSYGNITGKVFRDLPVNGTTLNQYGVLDSNEFGISDINVTAYNSSGTVVASILTDSDGNYTLSITEDGAYRVEFSNWNSYLKESPNASGSHTSVQFVKNGDSNINLGLHNPDDFTSTANPDLATTILIVGDKDDVGTGGKQDTIVTTTYLAEDGRKPSVSKDNTGSLWGLAYDSDKKLLYSASFLRRHSGLGEHGLGAVYVTDYNNNANTELFINVADNEEVGSVTRSEDDIKEHNIPTHDADAFGKIGKVGLGDIDITPDKKYLYVTNLYTKHILKYDIKNKSLKETLELPSDVCERGELRPFALKYHNSTLYSGAVCDTADSNDKIYSYVLKWNGSEFETVATADLSYYKEPAVTQYDDYKNCKHDWQSWTDTPPEACFWKDNKDIDDDGEDDNISMIVYPQPMLSDIEFDSDDNIILGFADRNSFQWGSYNYTTDSNDSRYYDGILGGDILRGEKKADGTYEIEYPVLLDDDDKNSSEFFSGEEFQPDPNTEAGHYETSSAGLAILQGSKEVVLSAMDPSDWSQGGLIWLSTQNGEQVRDIDLYKGHTFYHDSAKEGVYGKSGGIGDVELLTAPAPVEIGNRVWLDNNGNGIQDAGEEPISGVVVQLLDINDNLLSEVKTDNKGTYIFSNDPNGQDNTENGYDYNITSLIANNDYIIRIPNINGDNKQDVLENYILTKDNQGDDSLSNLRDSDGVLNGNNADATVLPQDISQSGVNNHSFDFGFIETYCIGDRIWLDENKNGIQDSSESNFQNSITITLLDENDNNITSITSTNGEYKFCSLVPDQYKIKVTNLPDGYVISPKDIGGDDTNDSDIDQSTKESDTIELQNDNLNIDIGVYEKPTYCLGDYIWYDDNKNGIQDSDEKGVENIKITLNDTNTTTITDSSGKYEFCGLENGDYFITVDKSTLPNGYEFTDKNQGSDDTQDSDINPVDGKSDTVTISESDNKTVDGGIYTQSSIGDKVWLDSNANGIQDTGEEGVSGVNVKLLKDCSTEINSTKTDGNGNYIFRDINPDEYCLEFELPNGYILSSKNIGSNDSVDSDVDSNTLKTETTTISSGENDMSWDMGIYQPATIGDKVWIDENANGIQDSNESGQSGITVELMKDCNTSIATKTTDSNGSYLFTDITPDEYCIKFSNLPDGFLVTTKDAGDDNLDSDVNSDTLKTDTITIESGKTDTSLDMGIYKLASIGDRVWLDKNANGIQDESEIGIANIEVTLLKDCTTNAGTTQTDNDGNYIFTKLQPDDYCLEFNIPTGAYVSYQDKGDDNNDSDVNPQTAKTISTSLTSGEKDMSWDMGIYYSAKLGDRVWYDNKNGIQDSGENGVADIKVILYSDDCDTKLDSTKTDENGTYLFDNLTPAKYCIEFTDLPKDYKVTARNIGDDDTNDSDANISTAKINNIILESNENNMSFDMGIYKELKESTTTTSTITTSSTSTTQEEPPAEQEETTQTEEDTEDNTATPTEEEERQEPIEEEEPVKIFRINDDEIEANTQGATTTIHVLNNDDEEARDLTIRLIDIKDGDIIAENGGTVVAGASIATTDMLVIPGEGIWRVDGDNITFTAQDGFEGTPTPIHYLVEDQQGNRSNIAEVVIKTDCNCESYVSSASDSVASFNIFGMTLLMLLTSLASLLFRDEK